MRLPMQALTCLAVAVGIAGASAPSLTTIQTGQCAYTIPTVVRISNTGGVLSIPITNDTGCPWTAGGGTYWLRTSATISADGSHLLLNVPRYPGTGRTGPIIISFASTDVPTQKIQIVQGTITDFNGDGKEDVMLYDKPSGTA